MPSLYAVFDTNTCRGQSWPDHEAMKKLERRHSVRGFASYFVASELLAHLADENDPALPAAVSSLRRLWDRSKRWNGSQEIIDFIADAEAELASTLYGVRPSNRFAEANYFGATIGELSAAPNVASLSPRSSEVIAHLAKHVQTVEQAFVDDLFLRVVKSVAPSASSWRDATTQGAIRDAVIAESDSGASLHRIAQAFAIKAAREAGVPASDELIREKGEFTLAKFPTPIHAYDLLVRDIVTKGVDMSARKHRNSIWDLHIAFSTGVGATFDGAPVWVITSDELLLTAARRAGTEARFRHPKEYISLLQSDFEEFRDALLAA